MSSDPLERMTELLEDAVSDPGDVEAMPHGRAAAIARLEGALRARGETRRRRRVFGWLAVAAAAALVIGGVALAQRGARPSVEEARVATPNGGVTLTRDGRSETISGGARVGLGAELRTAPGAEAQLDFESGTRVALGGSARMRLVEQGAHKRFALDAGALHAKVAKLGAGERFVIATADSEIEVRGTAFRVTLVAPDGECGGGTPTRLEVEEGTVVVRHGGASVEVHAGGRWPACTSRPAASSGEGPKVVSASPAELRDVPSAAPHPAARPLPSAASARLAEQNDLFDAALRAKRAGDHADALAKLDRLRATYPNSPLAENVDVERFRVLTAIDRRRGAEAARAYLKRHPTGFARAEAEALLGSTVP